jgi:hypothetical protein
VVDLWLEKKVENSKAKASEIKKTNLNFPIGFSTHPPPSQLKKKFKKIPSQTRRWWRLKPNCYGWRQKKKTQ